MSGTDRLNGAGHPIPGPAPVEMRPCGCRRERTAEGFSVTFCLPCSLATASNALAGAAEALAQAARGMLRALEEQRALVRRVDELERAAREARES